MQGEKKMRSVDKRFIEAPWMTYTEDGPSEPAKQIIPIFMENMKNTPMVPGAEIDFFDDTTPDNLVREDIEVNGQKGYFYKDPVRDRDQEKIVLYIHGGAMILGNGSYARALGFFNSNLLGLPTLSVEYRLSPAHRFPCHLDDVFAFYEYLLGVEVKVHIWHGLFHAFPTMFKDLPESQQVFAEMREFIRGNIHV
jgi:acetyl esterase/lipase